MLIALRDVHIIHVMTLCVSNTRSINGGGGGGSGAIRRDSKILILSKTAYRYPGSSYGTL